MQFHWFQQQRRSQQRLVILDDIFPHLLSAFRVAEYNAYFKAFPNAIVYSTATAFSYISETRNLAEVIAEYESYYPDFQGRVMPYEPDLPLAAELVYTIFLNNAFTFLEAIERSQIPFIFTLYPGGGFQLHDAVSDEKLARVCASPYLKKIITTQKVTYDYLLEKNFVKPEQVEFIYGVVLPIEQLAKSRGKRSKYRRNKPTFDICFVAYKYMEKGIDKGYNLFIESAHVLAKQFPDMRFHVVGNFDATDIDVQSIQNRVKFYGTQYTNFFPNFYAQMDIILSPNAPFVLSPGGFDGFPTGACTEAGLCGVAIFCSDVLSQNLYFQPQKEIEIIDRDRQDIVQVVTHYYHHPQRLYHLANRGRKALQKVFHPKNQILPRLKILSSAWRC